MTKENKFDIGLTVLIIALPVFMFLDVFYGSVSISFNELISVFNSDPRVENLSLIIKQYRIPKMLTALAAGMALPLSGLLMQTMFRNPLSGPFVLGISSGAGLGVALSLMVGAGLTGILPILTDINSVVAGSIGALMVMMIILYVSERVNNLSALLIVGVMIGSFASAIIGLLQYYSEDQELRNFIIWTMGSLGGAEFNEIIILYSILFLSILAVIWISKGLNAIAIGERYAHSLGIDIVLIRRISLFVASILAGSVTAIIGPIAFIGLAVPHIAKASLNTMNHKKLIPFTLLLGGILMLFFDLISQFVINDQIVPVNVITSLFGAPFVIMVVLRRSTKMSY